MNTVCSCVLILVVALLSHPAAAESANFSPAPLHVMNAQDIVNEPNGTQFVLNQDMNLTLKSSADVVHFAENGFEIRIFRLAKNGEPERLAVIDPCIVYFSNVYSAAADDDTVDLGSPNLDWLTVENHAFAPGRYILVFEDKSDGHNFFRLNKNDAQNYFSRGLMIVVKPDQAYGADAADQLADRFARAYSALASTANDNSSQYRCYQLRPLEGPRISMLETCARDAPDVLAQNPDLSDLLASIR